MPHGNALIDRVLTGSKRRAIALRALSMKTIIVADRYLSDCEMIANGGFSPLTGFMTRREVVSVLNRMRLPNGLIWTIPVVLRVHRSKAGGMKIGEEVALADKRGTRIAVVRVREIFSLDPQWFAERLYKTSDHAHPGVVHVSKGGDLFIAGPIRLIERPRRVGIDGRYYIDPAEMRREIGKRGWGTVAAFHTRNPIHRAHEHIMKTAAEMCDGLLIHPAVGETKPDDVPPAVRVRSYRVLVKKYFNPATTVLAVMPAPMHYAGPREAVHHLIVRKNYGCTHVIIGRDHAGVGGYYGSYEAHELVRRFESEIGVKALLFENAFYCKRCGAMATRKTCPHPSSAHLQLSGTKVREMVRRGVRPPAEYTRPEVADQLIAWSTKMSERQKTKKEPHR